MLLNPKAFVARYQEEAPVQRGRLDWVLQGWKWRPDWKPKSRRHDEPSRKPHVWCVKASQKEDQRDGY